ncbi:PPE domain-containing protein [Hoyosella subflava]|uniref:PPE family protein n=1 Tax=Hoyosella subflava (strain DSM 45089 / JCM 17490 / NBRC 109087 / DQS3-9A1) TaxID=443218 RepID=F6EE95_HOYSD|nr:PPE domain-containing protein [Hoyosella subflava]AEF38547.1 PPE family protein [Hoyosella subflava DQS3-9A1]
MGFTGIVWALRRVVRLATDLRGGARSGPMATASAQWSDMSTTLAETADQIAAVTRSLGESWRGDAAARALPKLGQMEAWLRAASVTASSVSTQARLCASGYDAANVAMPTEAEILAAQAMKAAGAAAPGVASGLTAAGEGMERALDIRAAAAMHGYEAACSPVGVAVDFPAPPALTNLQSAEPQSNPDGAIPDDVSLSTTPASAFSNVGSSGPAHISPAQVSPVAGALSGPTTPLAAVTQGASHLSHAAHSAATIAGVSAAAVRSVSSVLGTIAGPASGSSTSSAGAVQSTAPRSSVTTPLATVSASLAVGAIPASDRLLLSRGAIGDELSGHTRDADQRSSRAIRTPDGTGEAGRGVSHRTTPVSGARDTVTPAAMPYAPFAGRAVASAEEDDVRPLRKAAGPRESFDTGPAGQLVCPPIIGANAGGR